MSKRAAGANFGTGEERYGGETNHNMDNDKPQQATAAQLARRKIAQARKPGANRARSGSPAVIQNNTGTMQGNLFGNSTQLPQAPNAFSSSNFSFTFGGPQQQQQQESSASPAPFQFGASAPPSTQSQPNGNGTMFGNTPSFGTPFNAGSTQPQQNGFGQSTNIFSQPSQNNSQSTNNTTSFSFGQSQPAQQNGLTPATSTSSVFGSFGKQPESTQTSQTPFAFGSTQQEKEKTGTPFSGFGQEQQKSSTPFAGFGGGQQERERSNTPFTGFGATQTEKEVSKQNNPFTFGASQSKPQESGATATSAFTGFGQSKPDSNPASATSTGFGQQKSIFQQQPSGDAPKSPVKEAASNPFSGFGQAKTNGDKSATDNAPKPAFSFTPQPEKTTTGNMFGGLSQSAQPNGEKKGLFGASLLPAASSGGSESIFSNLPKKDLSNGGKPLFDSSDPSQVYREEDDQDENEADTTSNSIFGQHAQTAPQSSSNLFKPVGNGSQSTGTSLFQNSNAATSDISMTTPGSTPQKNLFSGASQPASLGGNASTTPAPVRSLFDRVDKDDVAKRMGRSDETPKTSLFSTTPATPATVKPTSQSAAPSATPAPGSLFKPAQPSQLSHSETPATAPSRSLFDRVDKPAPQPSGLFTPAPPAAKSTNIAAPATAPPARSAALFSSSSTEPAGIVPTVNLTDAKKGQMKQLNQAVLGVLQEESVEKDWTAIFDFYAKAAADIRGVPAPAPNAPSPSAVAAINVDTSSQATSASSLFAKTSTTGAAPATASNIFLQTPSSDKSNIFGKVPATAPAKKRVLEGDDDGPAQAPHSEKRSKPNEPISYPKLPQNASSTAKLFEAAMDSPKPPAFTGFKPSTTSLFSTSASQPASSAAAQPSVGGFKPSTDAGSSSSFLSAFGNKAKQQEEKDRKKRKDNDYDSDDETEEQWEKRDREEQEAKRRKLEEASKNAKGFTFSGTSTSTGDPGPKTPFKFGTSASGTISSTPAVPPPKINGLFEAAQAPPSALGKLAPGTGFNFGPKATPTDASRATTPGVTTDGEASTAADGDDAEPSDEQRAIEVEDHTALQPAEREASDVLLELQNTTTKTFRKTEDSDKPVWSGVGSGRLYVLKDKATGKIRVLNKVGVGRTALNYNPVKSISCSTHPKKPEMVVATFMDHIHSTPPKLERFYITTETADEAKELVKLLNEGAAK